MSTPTKTLTVELGARSYPIHIGSNILGAENLYRERMRGTNAILVTSENLDTLYGERVRSALAFCNPAQITLPDGEEHKQLGTIRLILDRMLENTLPRDCTVFALGGGVLGDMAGFAAAIYQRGVDFVQIPTTLLAQVDSSVGGKTGVNHPLGKNMIGAFHQPRAVLADTAVLRTLPEREVRAGIAEIIKYGLLGDAPFFDWLEAHISSLLALEPEALQYAIARACKNKAAIVAADERESGKRALLNLGHTFGHAIETATGYNEWLHGEAVAVGMYLATAMSRQLGWLSADDTRRVRALIERAGLPTNPPPDMTPARFIELMAHDKKVQSGQLRLILLRAIGEAVITADFPQSELEATLEQHTA